MLADRRIHGCPLSDSRPEFLSAPFAVAMSDPRFPTSGKSPDDERASLDATGEALPGPPERVARRAITEQLPAARPYAPLPDEDDDEDDEPTATLGEEVPAPPRPPARRARTEPLQPVSTSRTPTPPRALRKVGPDPWASVPDGVSPRAPSPAPSSPPRTPPPPAITRELRAPDPTGARRLVEAPLEDETFEVTDPVDPRELARAREAAAMEIGERQDERDAEGAWTAPPAVSPRWDPFPKRRAKAERLVPAPVPSPGVPDRRAPSPPEPSQPAPFEFPVAPPPEASHRSPPLPRTARPGTPAPPPVATGTPATAPQPSVAQLFRVDYRDNEKTAVEPVTFKPPPFWKVFPDRPEWWFVLSLLAVVVMGGALAWRITHKARSEELARQRAEQEALPPWMRGPQPPPPPPGMVVVPTGSGHELRLEDPGPVMPKPVDEDGEATGGEAPELPASGD